MIRPCSVVALAATGAGRENAVPESAERLPRPALVVATGSEWYRQVWPRVCRLFWLKCGGTTIIMTLFFAAYFQVLRHPAYPMTTMPATFIDALVPFYPPSLVAYISLWVYVPLAPALLLGLRELLTYGVWIVALCVSGLLIFYFWPTTMPPHGIDRSLYQGFDVLHGIDAAANACPSLHVATAAFSLYWFDRVLTEMNAGATGRALNVLWFAAIALSTMATKQHVFVDVVAGFAIGTAFALLSLRCRSAMSWQRYQRQRGFS